MYWKFFLLRYTFYWCRSNFNYNQSKTPSIKSELWISISYCILCFVKLPNSPLGFSNSTARPRLSITGDLNPSRHFLKTRLLVNHPERYTMSPTKNYIMTFSHHHSVVPRGSSVIKLKRICMDLNKMCGGEGLRVPSDRIASTLNNYSIAKVSIDISKIYLVVWGTTKCPRSLSQGHWIITPLPNCTSTYRKFIWWFGALPSALDPYPSHIFVLKYFVLSFHSISSFISRINGWVMGRLFHIWLQGSLPTQLTLVSARVYSLPRAGSIR